MMLRRVFAAVFLAGLVTLCVSETYTVEFKPFPCDFMFNTTAVEGEKQATMIGTYHGNFLNVTSDKGFDLARPDLGVGPDDTFFFVSAFKEKECSSVFMSKMIENFETMVFEHKEEDTLDGKSCYKYYNETDEVIWADADNNPLAKEITYDTVLLILTYTKLAAPSPREMFVLPKDYSCTDHPDVFNPPTEEAFAAACTDPSPAPSSGSIPHSEPTSSSVPFSQSTSSSSTPAPTQSSSSNVLQSSVSSLPHPTSSTSSSVPQSASSTISAAGTHGVSMLAMLCAVVMVVFVL